MGKREKLINAIRNNPVDVPFEVIINLLNFYGCKVRIKKHYIISHNALNYFITIPKGRKIKAHYAKDALKMIDDIKEALDIN